MVLTAPHSHALAADIVEEQFGKISSDTFKCLLDHGVQSLRQVVAAGKGRHSVDHLREALLILLQHGCVNAYLQEDDIVQKSETGAAEILTRRLHVYEASPTATIQRLRLPRILQYIRDEHTQQAPASRVKLENGVSGSRTRLAAAANQEHTLDVPDATQQAAALIGVLIEHGRMRPSAAVGAAAVRLEAAHVAQGGDPADLGNLTGKLHAAFRDLVRKRCLERSRPCNMLRLPAQPHKESRNRRGASQRQRLDAQQSAPALAARLADEEFQRLRFVAGPPPQAAGAKRKPGQPDSPSLPEKQWRGHQRPSNDENSDGEKPAVNGAAGTAALPAASAAQQDDQVLWCLSQEEFTRRFRHQAVIGFFRERHGGQGAAVVAAMLRPPAGGAGAPHHQGQQQGEDMEDEEGQRQDTLSPRLTQQVILQSCRELATSEWGPYLPTDNGELADALEKLCSLKAGGVMRKFGAGPNRTWCVHEAQVVSLLQRRQLYATVRDKFGPDGLRIFRLLADEQQQLEQKQVAESSLLPIKDAREILYSMLRADYLSLHDIPRSQEHAPSKTFYTFRASTTDACVQLQTNTVQALLNLRIRMHQELAQEEELVQTFKGMARDTQEVMKEVHGARLHRIMKVDKLLGSQACRLFQMLDLLAFY